MVVTVAFEKFVGLMLQQYNLIIPRAWKNSRKLHAEYKIVKVLHVSNVRNGHCKEDRKK
jgi:hypothetical protein